MVKKAFPKERINLLPRKKSVRRSYAIPKTMKKNVVNHSSVKQKKYPYTKSTKQTTPYHVKKTFDKKRQPFVNTFRKR